MFTQRRTHSMGGAVLTTLALIYHQTVQNLRSTHRNAIVGLLLTMLQASIMIMAFMLMYLIIGSRAAPLRGDFMLFIMSGIFLFMAFNQCLGKVAAAGKATSAMLKHGPMNTAISMCGAALAALYNNILTALVLVGLYHVLWQPIEIENWKASLGMLIFAWFSGGTIGLILLSVTTWLPEIGPMLSRIIRRVNMIASGKMFVANMMPNFMLNMFDWNPLFHLIDQNRGFVFINYTPHNSNLSYPFYFTLTALMIGLMAEFVTRNAISVSWNAAR